MTVTQIVGPRVAPLWADPVEWTSSRAYEPFTFVTYQGDSYCTRKETPIGIKIDNNDYWVKVSEYNAQAVALQRDTKQTIEANETAMQEMLTKGTQDITAIKNEAEASMNTSVAHVYEVANEAEASMNTSVAHVYEVANNLKDNVNQIQTNKNDITELENDITVLENDTMLVIGDSFSVIKSGSGGSEGPLWWEYLKHAYNFKFADSFAISGAGFVNSYGGTIPQQVNSAIEKYNTESMIKRVNAIYILGGLNDMILGTSADDWYNAVNSQVAKLMSHFTNARVFYMLNSTPYFTNQNISFDTFKSYIKYMQNFSFHFPTLYMAPYVEGRTPLYRKDVDNGQLLHPNARGEAYIANIWMGRAQQIPIVLCYNNETLNKVMQINNGTFLPGPCCIYLNNGWLQIQIGFKPINPSDDVVLTLPEWTKALGAIHSYIGYTISPNINELKGIANYDNVNTITVPAIGSNTDVYLFGYLQRPIVATASVATPAI